MRPAWPSRVRACGFTLLEVMLVLLLMGLATSVVIFNGFSTDKTEQLEQQARRFQVLTDMASDYAVMNQQQLGIRIDPQANGYFFMALDEDNRWQQLEGVEVYAPVSYLKRFR
ncbi:type II secretion system minor pseudopilin GspH [Salinimonas marina]|uniref:type II secretion system minor pseudopilin GspH n=1 Tax=Salinimonas marina TaxID=2785918 RepID=UPI002FC3052C